jgi:6-phosphofructokinase 2
MDAKRIITLTVNPALDKSTSVKTLVSEKKMRCANLLVEPGGGGVNVSRALKQLGHASTAMYFAGGYTGDFYTSLLRGDNIDTYVVPIEGHTRENIIVVDESSNQQYRFGMEGPDVAEAEWKRCLDMVREQAFDFLVASGSLAPGIPTSFFGQLAGIVKAKKARLIIDTSGEGLKDAVDEGVYMIKPNLGELSALYGVNELLDEDAARAAKEMIAKGYCEVIAVSMGAGGAMLVTKDEIHKVYSPTVKKKSTVGAGDSMVAGMLAGLLRGYGWQDVLRHGVAAGTAATMNEGTQLCKKEDTDRLFEILKRQ